MNNEPIQFLPPNRFWDDDKRRADQRALWMFIGLLAGVAGTVAFAWLIHLAIGN